MGIEIPLKIPNSDLSVKKLFSYEQLIGFKCTDSDLNDFIHNDSISALNEGTTKTHLVFYQGKTLVGFFSLSMDIIQKEHLEEEDLKIGFDPLKYPALKIARLATHQDWTKRGIGPFMLKHSQAIAYYLSNKFVGCRFITVDAYKDRVSWYQKYGFKLVESTKNKDHPKLYLNHIALREIKK